MSSTADARGNEVANDAGKASKPIKKPTCHEMHLQNALDEIAGKVQHVMREIKFSTDEKSNQVLITITDQVTQEVVRYIPLETVIDMAHRFDQPKVS